MRHIIEIFDEGTEKLVDSIEIPAIREKDLVRLMGWQEPEDELYGYNLSMQQVKVLEEWTGRVINSPNRIVQLVGVDS